MKKIVLIHFLLFQIVLTAQKIVVVDSLDKKPVEFAYITTSTLSFYTNKNGEFTKERVSANKYVEIDYLGYEKKQILTTNIKDTIKLKPTIYSLKPLTIDVKKELIVGFQKFAPRNKSIAFTPKSEFWLYLYPQNEIVKNRPLKVVSFKINKISLMLSKMIENDLGVPKPNVSSLYIRLKIIKLNKQNRRSEPLYISKVKKVYVFKKNEVIFKIHNKEIYFGDEGLLLILEYIGNDRILGHANYQKAEISFNFSKNNNNLFLAKTIYLNKETRKKININEFVSKNKIKNMKNLNYKLIFY